MNLFLTFDYELFFGQPTGSAKKCILKPTEELLRIAKDHKVKLTFFVDVGYLIQLEKWSPKYADLQNDYTAIIKQLQTLTQQGHDIQLHIHPHWETAQYQKGSWVVNLDGNYKLADLPHNQVRKIVTTYKTKLEEIKGRPIHGFRAGGWCLQPFDRFSQLFKEVDIRIDSTVFQGGYLETKHYYFDFRSAPNKGRYHFENDLCTEEESGSFLELPIGGYKYSAAFFWRLYILGRLFPAQHKMIGDGNFIAQGGKKYESLKKGMWDHVSCDGYYASKLNQITHEFDSKKRSDLVMIGHPKSMTKYSLRKLEEYIKLQQKKHSFLTLADVQ